MRFVDEAVITVQAGDGGNGVASFRRENLFPLVARMVATVVRAAMSSLLPMMIPTRLLITAIPAVSVLSAAKMAVVPTVPAMAATILSSRCR